MTVPLGIEEQALVLGHYRYVEVALFASTGSAGAQASSDELATFLSGASMAHGYRAELIAALLPVSVDLLDAAAPSAGFCSGIDELITSLADLDGTSFFACLVDVLYPQIRAQFSCHLDATASASDGPLRHVLRRMVFDLDLVTEEASAVRPLLGGADPAAISGLHGDLSALGGLYGNELRSLFGLG